MITLRLIQSMYMLVIVSGLMVLVILLYLRYLTNRAFKVQLKMVEANSEALRLLFLPRVGTRGRRPR